MSLPTTIKLDAADLSAFESFNTKQQAVQATFQQFAVAGERRMAELQAEGQSMWTSLGKKYGFDPQKVQYAFEDGSIVPKAVRL